MMRKRDTDKGPIAAAFICGAAIGMLTALMIAPKSGKETREDIANSLNDVKDRVSDKLTSGADSAKSIIGEAVATTKTVAYESKRAAKEAKQRVKDNRYKDDANDDDWVAE